MFLLPSIICSVIALLILILKKDEELIKHSLIFFIGSLVLTLICYGVNISSQTTDTEVWSGRIISADHKEEYDELKTETYKDSKGKEHTRTYIEHHYAKNYIKTSDNGNISVDKSLDGKRFDDDYPNTTEELLKYYPIGTPTASTHSYTNKVQASYSIYKHKDINLKQYEDLPKYPFEEYDYFKINRLIGDMPNKEKSLETLNEINSDLNSKDKKKQVNIIFVNVGDKSEDYGFALQDYWKGGNKNDFVVCFSMDSNNNIKWCYPFSWADSQKSEELKINVRDYMLKQNSIKDFSVIIKDIGYMVEQNFERKQFADFDYINVELSKGFYIAVIIFNAIGLFLLLFII